MTIRGFRLTDSYGVRVGRVNPTIILVFPRTSRTLYPALIRGFEPAGIDLAGRHIA